MKVKGYIRIARQDNGRPKIDVTSRPSSAALRTSSGYDLPTVAFAVEFNVPDELFAQARRVIAEIDVGMESAKIVNVVQVPA